MRSIPCNRVTITNVMMPDESDMSVEDLRTWVAALCHVVGAIIMASPNPGAIVGLIEGTLVVTPGDTARRDVIDHVRQITTELRNTLGEDRSPDFM